MLIKESIVYLLSGLALLIITGGNYSFAYDGDVDFSAPYLTLDPETGKLVTIDPTAETAPAQPHAAQSVPASTSNSGDNAIAESTATQTFPVSALVAIVIIALITLGIAAVKHKKGLTSSPP